MLRQDAGKIMLKKNFNDKKFHGDEGDDWRWLWQELRWQVVF